MAVRVGALAMPAIDRRTLLGIGLAALAATLVLIVTRPAPTYPVLVAGSDLAAGTPLSQLDIDVRRVADPSGLVQGSDVGDLAEWTLRLPVEAGEPIIGSLLAPPQLLATPDLLALELDASNAVLGRLAPGDLVDVYATEGVASGSAATRLVAESVFVVEAELIEEAGRDRVRLLLAVDDALAAELAAAVHDAELDLVLVAP